MKSKKKIKKIKKFKEIAECELNFKFDRLSKV